MANFDNLIKEYKFKVAFGQHSGIINETSNMYYLQDFLNEKYGEIEIILPLQQRDLGYMILFHQSKDNDNPLI